MRTKVRKASKGLPVPARSRSPQARPTTAGRTSDHALRRCQRGTHVPIRWRAAPRRDRAHGRPPEADADACPQGQQGTAGARAPRVAQARPTTAGRPRITCCGRCGGDASEARMCRCAGEQRRAGTGRTADRAKPTRTKVRKASKGLPVPARQRSPQSGPTTARRGLDQVLRQARRRCQRGTHVPMCWRAAPRRIVAESATKKGAEAPGVISG